MTKVITELIRTDDTWTLRPIGNVNLATIRLSLFVDSSVSLLKELVRAGTKKLFIDLIATESIDCDALRLLLKTQKEFAEEDIQIVLRNPSPYLDRLFRIMKLNRIFVIEPGDQTAAWPFR